MMKQFSHAELFFNANIHNIFLNRNTLLFELRFIKNLISLIDYFEQYFETSSYVCIYIYIQMHTI